MKRVSWLVVLAFFAFACELEDEIVVPVDPQAEGISKLNSNAARQDTENCGEEPHVCKEFNGETAWSEGNRYVTRGNWATYTPYIECRVDIYAGQNIYVGYIDFSAVVNNKVTITITLIGDWVLEDVKEAVKIQGYNVAPTGNPAPGRFTTYKGNALTITVDAYKFYGIHLDVGQWVEVECKI